MVHENEYAELAEKWVAEDFVGVAHRACNLTPPQLLELAAIFVTHPKVGVDELYKLSNLLKRVEEVRYAHEHQSGS